MKSRFAWRRSKVAQLKPSVTTASKLAHDFTPYF
jgi:hypothetical protein